MTSMSVARPRSPHKKGALREAHETSLRVPALLSLGMKQGWTWAMGAAQ